MWNAIWSYCIFSQCYRLLSYLLLQTAKLQIAKQNVIDLPEEISYQEDVVDLKNR